MIYYVTKNEPLIKDGKRIIPNGIKYVMFIIGWHDDNRYMYPFTIDNMSVFPDSVVKISYDLYGLYEHDILSFPKGLRSLEIYNMNGAHIKNNINIFPNSLVHLCIYRTNSSNDFTDANGNSIFPKTLQSLEFVEKDDNDFIFTFEKNGNRILPKNLRSLTLLCKAIGETEINGINYLPPRLRSFSFRLSHDSNDNVFPRNFFGSLPNSLKCLNISSLSEKKNLSIFFNNNTPSNRDSLLPKQLKKITFTNLIFDIPMIDNNGVKIIPDSVEDLDLRGCSIKSLFVNDVSIFPANLKNLEIKKVHMNDVHQFDFINEKHTVKALPESLMRLECNNFTSFIIPETDQFKGNDRRLLPKNLKTLILSFLPQTSLVDDNISILPDNLQHIKLCKDRYNEYRTIDKNNPIIFPKKLKRLDLSEFDDCDLYSVKNNNHDKMITKLIPDSVKYLGLPKRFNKPLIVDEVKMLPNSLLEFCTGSDFNQNIITPVNGKSVFPEGFTSFGSGYRFNQVLSFPSSIVDLTLGLDFCQPLYCDGISFLPDGIKCLTLYISDITENTKYNNTKYNNTKYNDTNHDDKKQIIEVLPDSIEKLTLFISNKASLILSCTQFPKKLKDLSITVYGGDFKVTKNMIPYKAFPYNIKTIEIEGNYDVCIAESVKVSKLIDKTLNPMNPIAQEIIENYYLHNFD